MDYFNRLMFNPVTDGDIYKWTHSIQYPIGLNFMQSHGIARRSSKFELIHNVGLTMILQDYFTTPVTEAHVNEALMLCEKMTGNADYFPYDTWMRVVNELDGKIPVVIRALPEGIVVPKDTPLFTIEPTVDWFTPCMQWIETLLMHVWLI